jgi:hypothetical protein
VDAPESDPGLDFLKEKIVAQLKAQGTEADITSAQVHAMALDVRAELDKQANEARERLRKRFSEPTKG